MADETISVNDITKCGDCEGLYDPCERHLARINELGVGRWEATGDISIEDVPRETRYYTLTKHAQHRMGSRRLNKRIAHHVIENGEIKRAKGENTFKFIGETRNCDEQTGNCVVVVSVTKERLEKSITNPIITVYMEDSESDLIDQPEKKPSEAPSSKEKEPSGDLSSKKGWKHLDYGEEYSTTIHHTSRAGDGIIQVAEEDGYQRSVNIGPVVEGAAGKHVKVKKMDNQFGVCLTEPVREKNYIENHPKNRDTREDTANSTVDDDPEVSEPAHSRTLDAEPSAVISPENVSQEIREPSEPPHEKEQATKEKQKEGQETEDPTDTVDTSPVEKEKPSSIDQLRKDAEAAAITEVSQRTTTIQQSKPEYSRSPEVKQYVKARADGLCEGCGEPAPFISKTGEPYLHAHHINELSGGGSDTPDTVIALCPNCHYRVHHGEDGEEYNKELLAVVKEKEQ